MDMCIRLDKDTDVTVSGGYTTGEIDVEFKIEPEEMMEQILDNMEVMDIVGAIVDRNGVDELAKLIKNVHLHTDEYTDIKYVYVYENMTGHWGRCTNPQFIARHRKCRAILLKEVISKYPGGVSEFIEELNMPSHHRNKERSGFINEITSNELLIWKEHTE